MWNGTATVTIRFNNGSSNLRSNSKLINLSSGTIFFWNSRTQTKSPICKLSRSRWYNAIVPQTVHQQCIEGLIWTLPIHGELTHSNVYISRIDEYGQLMEGLQYSLMWRSANSTRIWISTVKVDLETYELLNGIESSHEPRPYQFLIGQSGHLFSERGQSVTTWQS